VEIAEEDIACQSSYLVTLSSYFLSYFTKAVNCVNPVELAGTVLTLKQEKLQLNAEFAKGELVPRLGTDYDIGLQTISCDAL